MTSNELDASSIELIRSNARLVYGRHLTYDVIFATKASTHAAVLMSYEAVTLYGNVRLVEEVLQSGGSTANGCRRFVLEKLSETLIERLGEKMGQFKVGIPFTTYEGILLGEGAIMPT